MDINEIILSLDTDDKKKKYFLNNFLNFKEMELTESQDVFFLDLTKKYYKDLKPYQMVRFRDIDKCAEWFIKACDKPEFIEDLINGKSYFLTSALEFPGLENKLENFNCLVSWKFSKKTTMPIPNINKKIKGYNYLKSSILFLEKLSNADLAKAYMNNKLLPMENKMMKFLINLDFHQKLLKEKSNLLPNDPISHRSEKQEILDFFTKNTRWGDLREFKGMYWNIITNEEHWNSFNYFDRYNEINSVEYPLNSFSFFEKALGRDVVDEMFAESLITDKGSVNIFSLPQYGKWHECLENAYLCHFKNNYKNEDFLNIGYSDDNLPLLVNGFIRSNLNSCHLEKYDDEGSKMAHSVISWYVKNKPVSLLEGNSVMKLSFGVSENPLQVVLKMKDEHLKDFYPYLVATLLKEEIDFMKNPHKNHHLFDLKIINGTIPINNITDIFMNLTLEKNVEIHQQLEKDMKQKITPHPYLKKIMISDIIDKNSLDFTSDDVSQNSTGFKL